MDSVIRVIVKYVAGKWCFDRTFTWRNNGSARRECQCLRHTGNAYCRYPAAASRAAARYDGVHRKTIKDWNDVRSIPLVWPPVRCVALLADPCSRARGYRAASARKHGQEYQGFVAFQHPTPYFLWSSYLLLWGRSQTGCAVGVQDSPVGPCDPRVTSLLQKFLRKAVA